MTHRKTWRDEVVQLGPNDRVDDGTFERCRITVAKPNAGGLFCCRFVDCEITVRGKFEQSWANNQYERCVFKGYYFDVMVGEYSQYMPGEARMIDCDFRQAKLHHVIFVNCDPTRIQFPTWPHVTILDREALHRALADYPDDAICDRLYLNTEGSSGGAFVVYHIEEFEKSTRKTLEKYQGGIVRWYKADLIPGAVPTVDIERTRQILSTLPGILM
jgi:hypothetical protein